jgi:hypothetical protein
MSANLRRALDVTSALFGVIALALVLWPVSVRVDDVEARELPLATRSAPAGPALSATPLDSSVIGIVRGNVFSSSRRAPSTRFVAPGAEAPAAMAPAAGAYVTSPTTDAGSGGNAAGIVSDSMASVNTDAAPALYGIVSVNGSRRALLTLRAGETPRLFAVGDRHAGYRISAIEADRVVVHTARGSRTLRMARPASRDSSENSP